MAFDQLPYGFQKLLFQVTVMVFLFLRDQWVTALMLVTQTFFFDFVSVANICEQH